MAKLYSTRLQKLFIEYESRGVMFLGINSNLQDSITEIEAFTSKHKITFPMLKDVGNEVAIQMQASRTPEVFVLGRSRTVEYHGRIDDQYGIGYVRDQPTRKDLEIALNELLAGKSVSMPTVESVGCVIGRIRKPVENANVTYSNQIASLFQRRCVECHRPGQIAPFALTDYSEVAGWAEMIAEVVEENRMPPWHADPKVGHFANDRHLTDEEKSLIYRWVEDGAPEGDPTVLPIVCDGSRVDRS